MNGTFIFEDYLQDLAVCDKLIEHFENSDRKFQGKIGANIIDLSLKDSTDLWLDTNDDKKITDEYMVSLKPIIDKYVEKFPYAMMTPFKILESFKIQKYNPGQAYHKWHAERASDAPVVRDRHLVFMTYLNDVYDAGGTEFFHQGIKISARKGLTVVWPSDWTYTHRGEVSTTETKYIITGWTHYSSYKQGRNYDND